MPVSTRKHFFPVILTEVNDLNSGVLYPLLPQKNTIFVEILTKIIKTLEFHQKITKNTSNFRNVHSALFCPI
jgi:hypothetical protein